jgi:CxxC motif-containing protein
LSLNRHEKNKYVSKKTSIPMQKKHTMNLWKVFKEIKVFLATKSNGVY